MDRAGKVYDGVGPVPAEHFNAESFTRQISKHLLKDGVDHVVVDVTGLGAQESGLVRSFVNALDPASRARVIIQGH